MKRFSSTLLWNDNFDLMVHITCCSSWWDNITFVSTYCDRTVHIFRKETRGAVISHLNVMLNEDLILKQVRSYGYHMKREWKLTITVEE